MNNQKKVSYAVLNAIQKLTDEKTKPQFRVFRDSRGNAYLNVTNAVLLWTNFSGTSYGGRQGNNSLDQFGKDKRYFNLALDEETANMVEELGWNEIQSINKSLQQLTISIKDPSNRPHDIIITFPATYPKGKPIVNIALPREQVIKWKDENSIQQIIIIMKEVLKEYNEVWNVLEDFDKNCIVLDPSKPTFSHSYRRLYLRISYILPLF